MSMKPLVAIKFHFPTFLKMGLSCNLPPSTSRFMDLLDYLQYEINRVEHSDFGPCFVTLMTAAADRLIRSH